jgi:hypothetical protein
VEEVSERQKNVAGKNYRPRIAYQRPSKSPAFDNAQ